MAHGRRPCVSAFVAVDRVTFASSDLGIVHYFVDTTSEDPASTGL